MKYKFRFWLTISLLLVPALGFGFAPQNKAERSIFPYKDRPEIQEAVDYFTAHPDKNDRLAFLKDWARKYRKLMEVQRTYQDLMRSLGEEKALLQEFADRYKAAPKDPDVGYLYARLMVGTPEEEAILKQVLEIDKDHYWAHLGLAYFYLQESSPPKDASALEHLNAALEIDKTRPNAYFSVLTLYRYQKKNDKLLETLDVLTKFFPDSNPLFLQYAELRFPKAEDAKRALLDREKSYPKSAEIKNALAGVFQREGQADKALTYLETALGLEKENGRLIQAIHIQMADIYGLKKDEKATIAHLQEAVKIGLPGMMSIQGDKNFDFLRGNSIFEELLKKIEAAFTKTELKAVTKK